MAIELSLFGYCGYADLTMGLPDFRSRCEITDQIGVVDLIHFTQLLFSRDQDMR